MTDSDFEGFLIARWERILSAKPTGHDAEAFLMMALKKAWGHVADHKRRNLLNEIDFIAKGLETDDWHAPTV